MKNYCHAQTMKRSKFLQDEQGWGTPGTDGWGAPAEPQGSWDEPAVPQKETPDPDPPQPEPVQLPSNEPKTFANLFKNSQGFPAAPAPAASQPSSHAQPTPPAQQQPPQVSHSLSLRTSYTEGGGVLSK